MRHPDLYDLADRLRDADFGTARGPDSGKAPCARHAWGRTTVEDCGGEPTAFRCCQACSELQDCNLVLLSECLLNGAA